MIILDCIPEQHEILTDDRVYKFDHFYLVLFCSRLHIGLSGNLVSCLGNELLTKSFSFSDDWLSYSMEFSLYIKVRVDEN